MSLLSGLFQSTAGGPAAYSITGDVTLSLTPGATMDYIMVRSITGDVTLTLVPSATMDFTRNASITGAVVLTLTPGATKMQYLAGGVAPEGIAYHLWLRERLIPRSDKHRFKIDTS